MRLDSAGRQTHKAPHPVTSAPCVVPLRGLRRAAAVVCVAGACAAALTARPSAQAAGVPVPSLTAPGETRPRPDEARIAVARLVEEHRLAIAAPAISAALVLDGRLAWADGFGEADLENGVPARAETIYRLASISKPMAATAVMQLVERGVVSLEDDIQKYAPEFPRKPQGEVRLRHLLTHTSGVRHYKGNEFNSREYFPTTAAGLRIFKDDPLLFAPGSAYEYTTYGYNLLAAVVERASGLNYEQYLHERIFGPAAMTTARLEHPEDIVRFRARQYARDTRPAPAGPLRNAPYVDLSYKWAGGGIIASALDVAHFDIALNEGRLLRPETLQQMYTSARLTSGRETGYGLGWMLVKDARGRTWVGHSGGATGGTTYLLRHPESRTAVVLLCNVESAPGLAGLALRIAGTATGTVLTPTP